MAVELKTVREVITMSTDYLDGRGIESARLSAELLLGEVLGLSRIELYFHYDRPLDRDELGAYREFIRRRGTGQPLQTLIGTTEFYSRSFKVEPGVFIPRPETEILVEHCVDLMTPAGSRRLAPAAVEIGCGTGVIGVTLAIEIPALSVHAVDVNPAAVSLTRRNAARHGVEARIDCYEGALYTPLPDGLAGGVDLLVSNPPYIRSDDIDSLAIEVSRHDPREALDGGTDGLVAYRALAAGFERWLAPGAVIAVEIGFDQGESVPEIFERAGCGDISVYRDYNEQDRVVTARWPVSDPTAREE